MERPDLYPPRTSKHPDLQAFYDYLERLVEQRIKDGWDNPYNNLKPITPKTKTKRMPGF